MGPWHVGSSYSKCGSLTNTTSLGAFQAPPKTEQNLHFNKIFRCFIFIRVWEALMQTVVSSRGGMSGQMGICRLTGLHR